MMTTKTYITTTTTTASQFRLPLAIELKSVLNAVGLEALIDPKKLVFRTLVQPSHFSQIYLVKRRFQLMTPAAARFWEFAQEFVARDAWEREAT